MADPRDVLYPTPGRCRRAVFAAVDGSCRKTNRRWRQCRLAPKVGGYCWQHEGLGRQMEAALPKEGEATLRRLLAALASLEAAAGGDGAELNAALDAVIEAGREVRGVLGGEVPK